MAQPNYKKIWAIRKANEDRIKKICPEARNDPGIYVFWRIDENGISFAYLGQARQVWKRMSEHLSGYQHIDLSLKKHKFYDEETTPYGYHAEVVCYCSIDELDELERRYIKEYADKGYQLRNVSSGAQGANKGSNINNGRPARGYRDGLSQGYKNASRDVSKLFEKNLTYGINGKPTVNKEKALAKFEAFLNEHKTEDKTEENEI